MTIRDATEADLPALLEIHNDAVRTLDALWSEHEDTPEERAKWFRERKAAGFPIVVWEGADGRVTGYASYGFYRPREGYRLTVEHSIYLLPEGRGKGAGKTLLEWVIADAKARGFHALIAGIDSKNTLSIALHEKYGFGIVSRMSEIGQKHGHWLDLIQMQLLLDDRKAPPKDK